MSTVGRAGAAILVVALSALACASGGAARDGATTVGSAGGLSNAAPRAAAPGAIVASASCGITAGSIRARAMVVGLSRGVRLSRRIGVAPPAPGTDANAGLVTVI